ncbi:hypothetical protein OG196_00180 [Kitasatospora purpeofusca]|uniref:hypothetical protein n=1 Tax=Kitasatospora purpeofusca TaxID=67352 RepID=UPI002E1087A7|nr:hypothetical protein OG196_00180 [Kitasatospora purpeofusca]
MTFPQAPALPEELDRLMRRMRLPYMRKAAPDVLATARAQRWDPAEVLRLLIAEEVTGRDAATRRLRRHSANFPTGKTLGSWRAEDSTIPEPTQNSLITLEWIGRAVQPSPAGTAGPAMAGTTRTGRRSGRSSGHGEPHRPVPVSSTHDPFPRPRAASTDPAGPIIGHDPGRRRRNPPANRPAAAAGPHGPPPNPRAAAVSGRAGSDIVSNGSGWKNLGLSADGRSGEGAGLFGDG